VVQQSSPAVEIQEQGCSMGILCLGVRSVCFSQHLEQPTCSLPVTAAVQGCVPGDLVAHEGR
jgi:hypothetical protein